MNRLRISRRKFLFLGAGAIALSGAGYGISRRPLKLALIGAGIRGRALSASLSQLYWLPGQYPDVVAICDVDSTHANDVRELHWPRAETYGNYHKVLERDDIKGVIISTPDHWHALIAHHALKAGKAVYLEKPISLTVAEGQFLVRSVNDTKGVLQTGTIQRSDWRFRTAAEIVRNDRLGKLHKVSIGLPQRWGGTSPGPFAATEPPAELDWEQWLGQAPMTGYCRERTHGLFRRWYEYAGGTMTDWGAHHLDIAQWAMGMDDSGPRTIEGTAEFPKIPGGFNTPLVFRADLHYANGVRVHIETSDDEEKNGITFEGDAGSIFVSRGKFEGAPVEELRKRPFDSDAIRLHETSGHKKNVLSYHLLQFFDCIDGAQPIADVFSQHRSATACHLTNIAMRLGRKITWDAAKEEIIGDTEASAMLSRPQRTPYQLPLYAGG